MAGEGEFDMLVIGGGINGAGIARDAAGRGLRVLLCEQDDLASHTSSSSSKLIHGGLRYLEHRAFRLVSKALAEREVLLRAAPHIIWPLRFVMPHDRSLRPAWMIRLGLFLYDHLDFGKRRLLKGSEGLDLRRHPAGAALREHIVKGFAYSDGWAQDARLVVLNAMDAAERGARVLTRTRCVAAHRDGDCWRARLQSTAAGAQRAAPVEVSARALVNAAGPWVSSLLDEVLQQPERHAVRLVKGSHIVVPRLFDHDYAYILQNTDKRVVFALPYEGDYTLIGTTDLEYRGDPAAVAIDDDEIGYLCAAVNRYFRRSVGPADVIWHFAGVRPLVDDESGAAAEVSRDYRLALDAPGAAGEAAGAPLLSVFGGKITTYRRLAEEAVDLLAPALGCTAGGWTAGAAPLPGGDLADADFDAFLAAFRARHAWLSEALALRYARSYGSRAELLIGDADSPAGLGAPLGDEVFAAELDYLASHEWARCAEDVLWRRSKLGLHIGEATRRNIELWFDENLVRFDRQAS